MFPKVVLIGLEPGTDKVLEQQPLASEGRNERWLRDFLFDHPEALPAAAIDPAFADPVPVCRELRTIAGPVDVLFVNRHGALVLVECKLWRNPEARREVVGQILDYAKELARWRYEDLQREVSRARGEPGVNALFNAVAAAHPEIREAEFVDQVSRNLSSGRFLLLVVGDGIREGTESIVQFVARHSGLHFTFGLVEVVSYGLPDGRLIVQPRLLARSVNLREQASDRSIADGFAQTSVSLVYGLATQYEDDRAVRPDSDGFAIFRNRLITEAAVAVGYARRRMRVEKVFPIGGCQLNELTASHFNRGFAPWRSRSRPVRWRMPRGSAGKKPTAWRRGSLEDGASHFARPKLAPWLFAMSNLCDRRDNLSMCVHPSVQKTSPAQTATTKLTAAMMSAVRSGRSAMGFSSMASPGLLAS